MQRPHDRAAYTVAAYLSWGERYNTSLLQLEEGAEKGRYTLKDRLRKLGYVDLG